MSKKHHQVDRHALLTVAQMREADRLTIAGGTPGLVLMERAGAAVADAARRFLPPHGRIAVLCGPGNNGGDGFAAARILHECGLPVRVYLSGNREQIKGDAALALAAWPDIVQPISAFTPPDADIVIDALFGAGLVRAIDGGLAGTIRAVNTWHGPVVAVDVPSGVDGDSGQVRGIAVNATATVTFFRRKPGHVLMPGRAMCGEVHVADIGIAPAVLMQTGIAAHENMPALWMDAFPPLREDGHKFQRGHALVVAGGLEGVGAPRLSARAALRAGAGLVTIAAPPEALAAHAARGPDALMVRSCADAAALTRLLSDTRRNVCVIGPALGLDASARNKVDAVLRSAAACVIDADGLTLLAGRADAIARAAGRKAVVLTPHDGEFARLFGPSRDDDALNQEAAGNALFSDSKLQRALAAAQQTQAVIVLKGADTVIATPDGRAAINVNAPPWLATAGAGDVLAGLIGGLLAQQMPPFEAACAAVFMHGATAAQFRRGMIADDLVDALAWPSA